MSSRLRTLVFIVVVIVLCSIVAYASDSDPFYTNNTPGAVHMMRASNGYYYSYVGNWNIFRSDNMTSWQLLPEKCTPHGSWGVDDFWVPEVVEHKGKFYMFYTARAAYGRPSHRIGLAIADKPEGPFKDIGHHFFKGTTMDNWYVIDPNPFIDPDTGEKYLYFVYRDLNGHYIEDLKKHMESTRVYGVKLSDDLLSTVSEPVLLIKPSQSWEYISYTRDGLSRLWLEAPEIMKINGMYYITYSTNAYTTNSYNIGYAASPEPLGVYTKFDLNPVIGETTPPLKAGHNSVVLSPDGSEYFTAYQAMNDARYLSRVGTRADGTLFVNGHIAAPQIAPNGSTEFINHATQATVTTSTTKQGYRATGLTDGEVGVYDRLERYDWVSDGAGAWIRLAWDKPVIAEYVVLYDSAVKERMVRSGHVVTNDDPKQTVHSIRFTPGRGEAAIVHFPTKREITSLTFYIDETAEANGVAGMTEIAVLGHEVGHVWLASPAPNAVVSGEVPVELKGLTASVAQVNVEVAPVSLEGTASPKSLYSGSKLPDRLTLDTFQIADGPYDLVYRYTAVDGQSAAITHRFIVRNWETLEDGILPTTSGGWFGEVVQIRAVTMTNGWEFTGSDNDAIFSDINRIKRKAATLESLTWNMERLHDYAFTMYARRAEVAQTVQVEMSPDGETWIPVMFSTRVVDKAADWWQISVEGAVPLGTNANYIRLVFRGDDMSADMQLGHVTLRGLSVKQ